MLSAKHPYIAYLRLTLADVPSSPLAPVIAAAALRIEAPSQRVARCSLLLGRSVTFFRRARGSRAPSGDTAHADTWRSAARARAGEAEQGIREVVERARVGGARGGIDAGGRAA